MKNYDSVDDIQNMDKYNVYRALETACYEGDLEIVKCIFSLKKIKHKFKTNSILGNFLMNGVIAIDNMLTKLDIQPLIDINNNNGTAFRSACYSGNLELVQYLLFSPELKKHADIFVANANALYEAAKRGHIEIVKLLNEEIIRKGVAPDKLIGSFGDNLYSQCISIASGNNHIEVIDYLLSQSSDNKKKLILEGFNCLSNNVKTYEYYLTHYDHIININSVDHKQRLFSRVFLNKDTTLLHYLTSDANLKNKLKIDPNDDQLIIELLEANAREAAKYLIFNHNITKTDNLIKQMQYDGPEMFEVFDKRDLNNRLRENLEKNNLEQKTTTRRKI